MDYYSTAGSALVIGTLVGASLGIIITIVLYVLTSLGIYKIIKARGHQSPAMAWIPFYRYYLLGIVIEDEAAWHGAVFSGTRWILCLGPVLNYIPTINGYDIGGYLYTAFVIYLAICIYAYAKKYDMAIAACILTVLGLTGIPLMVIGSRIEKGTYGTGYGSNGGAASGNYGAGTSAPYATPYTTNTTPNATDATSDEMPVIEVPNVETVPTPDDRQSAPYAQPANGESDNSDDTGVTFEK